MGLNWQAGLQGLISGLAPAVKSYYNTNTELNKLKNKNKNSTSQTGDGDISSIIMQLLLQGMMGSEQGMNPGIISSILQRKYRE